MPDGATFQAQTEAALAAEAVLARYVLRTPVGQRTEALQRLIRQACASLETFNDASDVSAFLADLAGKYDERRAA